MKYRLARGREQLDRDVSLGRVGWELFPFLILAAALLLAAEHLLASRFYGRDPSKLSDKARVAKQILSTKPGQPERVTGFISPLPPGRGQGEGHAQKAERLNAFGRPLSSLS